ncbi:MAG TPA: O-antigen ligase family protein [Steroidobacter sp.]
MNVPAGRTRRRNNEGSSGFLFGWLLLALFLEYARPASYFPFLNVPFFYSLFPVALFAVSLAAPGLRPMKEVMTDRLAKWVFILLGLVFLSMLVYRSYAIDTFTMVLGYVMLFVLIARICTTWGRVRGVIVTLLLAHLFLLAMNPNVVLDPTTRQYIVGATFLGDGNDYGLSLCLLFPCALELAQSRRSLWSKILCYGAVVLLLFAIIATQSRGATLGLGAVLFFMWLRSSRKLVGLVGVAVVGVAVLIYAPPQYFDRMSSLGAAQLDGSAQGRIDAWKAGIGMVAHNPVLGVGAGHFGPRWGKTAHSTYVLAMAELGLPGLVCVLMLVIGNMRANMALRSRVLAASEIKDQQEERARLLFLTTAAVIGFAVAGAFLSATYYPHLYVLTGLLIAVRLMASQGLPEVSVGEEAKRRRRAARLRQVSSPASVNRTGASA